MVGELMGSEFGQEKQLAQKVLQIDQFHRSKFVRHDPPSSPCLLCRHYLALLYGPDVLTELGTDSVHVWTRHLFASFFL
jgi:hypothetical protein